VETVATVLLGAGVLLVSGSVLALIALLMGG
jgi:hypothetical protein